MLGSSIQAIALPPQSGLPHLLFGHCQYFCLNRHLACSSFTLLAFFYFLPSDGIVSVFCLMIVISELLNYNFLKQS